MANQFVTLAAFNTLFVFLSAVLVLLMQAGFLLLELGFSRMKNVAAGVAKVLANLSIAGICYWACGFAFAFGVGEIIGTNGFFLHGVTNALKEFPAMGFSNASIAAKWLFQFSFCAVALAIVWGTTLERIRWVAYLIYGAIFASLIYPLASHWVFGGGFLQANLGMQDFAGSTAVHLVGATGALAACLLLGPRLGKYNQDGSPRPIPGHSMPLVGLAALILFVGWMGFNPGSALNAGDGRFAEIAIVTVLGAFGGVLGALLISRLVQKTVDVGMVANGMIGGLVAITAPSGYIEYWPAPLIGFLAGILVVFGVLLIDSYLDDPVGALSAHGLAGIWGTVACGLFTAPRLAQLNGVGQGGLLYTGSFNQLLVQLLGIVIVFLFVFSVSLIIFYLIKKTVGLRVSAEEEESGLDISEHGAYGYPEHFLDRSTLNSATLSSPSVQFSRARPKDM